LTLATESNRNDYTGDGTTTAFAFTFKILAQGDLEVYVDSTLQTITVNYTVSGVGSAAGGTVTFTSAPDDDAAVSLVRNAAFTQSVDFVDNDSFSADTLEGALDRLTMLCQQAKEIATRTVRFAAGSVHAAAGVIFPDFVASKYVRVNSDCTGFELVELTDAGTYADPVTTPGDLIQGSAAGVQSRLAAGSCDSWLSVLSTGLLTWRAKTYDPNVTNKGQLLVGTAENTVAPLSTTCGNYILVSDCSTTTGLAWTGIENLALAASQAQMENCVTTTSYVTPGRMHFHPGVAKAFARWDTVGFVCTSYNVLSIDDDGTGNWGINFATGFSSGSYIGQLSWLGTANNSSQQYIFDALNAASAEVIGFDSSGSAAEAQTTALLAVFYGDHA
jgi:hypothetical protein